MTGRIDEPKNIKVDLTDLKETIINLPEEKRHSYELKLNNLAKLRDLSKKAKNLPEEEQDNNVVSLIELVDEISGLLTENSDPQVYKLIDLRKKIMSLSEEEQIERDLYLRGLQTGKLQGPKTGFASIDKPWLKQYTEEAIKAKVPKKTAYRDMLDSNKGNEDGYAINFYGKKMTYREMLEEIDYAATAFKRMGIKKGDYVTFCMPTLPQTIISFYALNKIGAVANFVDLRMNKENILRHVNNTNSQIIITMHGTLKKCEEIFDESTAHTIIDVKIPDSLPTHLKAIYNLKTKEYKDKLSDHTISWDRFLTKGLCSPKAKEEPYEKDRPAGIVYTGGTTGEPKGAILTNDNLNNMKIEYLGTGMEITKNDVFMNIMPPFISYGFVIGLHLPMACGLENLLIPKFNPKEMGKLLEKYEPNFFIGVPSHFEFMLEDKKLKKADLSYLKVSASGGDAMNPTKEKAVNDFLISHGAPSKLRIGHGMTENSSATNTEINDATTKEGSVGFPLPKNIETIIDKDGHEIRIASLRDINGEDHYNNEGELMISGPTMVKGYYENEEEEKKTFIHDSVGQRWIKSGDNVKMEEDGRISIIGRIKNMIVRPDGHNVWPALIENTINSYPLVEDTCVVGLKTGEIPTAYVVLKDKSYDEETARKEILEHQDHILPERDGALEIRFIDEIPLTPVGKKNIIKLKKMAEESEVDFDTVIGQKKTKTKKKQILKKIKKQ